MLTSKGLFPLPCTGMGNAVALGAAMKERKFSVGVLLIVGAIGYLIYTAVLETSTYYLTLEEFVPQKEALASEGVRVAGRVQAGSVNWQPKDLRLHFILGPLEKEKVPQLAGIPVQYQGVLPDMFAEGRDVIVEGRYAVSNAFMADTIMTSCPSKYEPAVKGP
jgi:cytochrome c-type biogenesis protein CcmE